MGADTTIEWTTHTWNPWQGCAKVSPGCDHCYMFSDKRRYGQDPETVVRSKPPTFSAPLKIREPGMVFTCSWSDWFIRDADDWRAEAWDIIRRTPHLTYQILTKRPSRMKHCLPPDWGAGYSNVWLGVSVESQEHGRRVTTLLETPAHKRFVSAEPLLGPLSLGCIPWSASNRGYVNALTGVTEFPEVAATPHGAPPIRPLDWVIVGGESGDHSRPFDVAWARSLVKQCQKSGVAVFVKQLGARPFEAGAPVQIRTRKGGDLEDLPEDLRVREFPRG